MYVLVSHFLIPDHWLNPRFTLAHHRTFRSHGTSWKPSSIPMLQPLIIFYYLLLRCVWRWCALQFLVVLAWEIMINQWMECFFNGFPDDFRQTHLQLNDSLALTWGSTLWHGKSFLGKASHEQYSLCAVTLVMSHCQENMWYPRLNYQTQPAVQLNIFIYFLRIFSWLWTELHLELQSGDSGCSCVFQLDERHIELMKRRDRQTEHWIPCVICWCFDIFRVFLVVW